MKNLKNIVLFSLIAVMTLASSQLFAQNNSAVSKDQTFVSYVKSQMEFTEKGNPSLVKKLATQEMKNEKDLNSFYKAFNTNEKEYKSHLEKQNGRLQYLNKKYNLNSYSEKELTAAIQPIIESIDFGDNDDDVQSLSCIKVLRLTQVAIIVGATAAHAACGNTGVFEVICHSGVDIVAGVANDLANTAYELCRRGGN